MPPPAAPSAPADAGTANRPAVQTDTTVGLAFYGSIVYVAVVAALGAQTPPAGAAPAISAVAAAASVLYVAHVFAALAPKAARAGRLHAADLLHALRHDSPLLFVLLVPIAPLLLALGNLLELESAYRLSVRLTMGVLFVLTVALSRREGLGWRRSIVSGGLILVVTITIAWLETQVH
jgi:hypothetical protein